MKKYLLIILLLVSFCTIAGAGNLSDAYGFPVPFKPSEGDSTITFTNLAAECTIRIFTMSGNLVATLSETDGDGQYSWNVKNTDGSSMISGIYLYHIQSSSDSKVGKLLIVK